MKKRMVFAALLLCSLTACEPEENDAASTPAVDAAHNSRNALDWSGTYQGTLPCADCEGIETVLTLSDDSTYTLRERYRGKSDQVLVEQGEFVWDESGGIIRFQGGRDGAQYRVGEGRLFHLDAQGERISGALAEAYVLQKHEDTPLAESYWKLVELKGMETLEASNEPHLIFRGNEPRVFGSGGCNRIMGAYELGSEGGLRLSRMAGTMMACVQGMELEQHFLKTLEEVEHHAISGEELVLSGGDHEPLARFRVVYLR